MLFPIAIVDSVEMIRDGGSLAAIFHGPDGCEYWLFFEICIRNLSEHVVERVGYAPPKVVNRHTGTEVSVTWEDASTMLKKIAKITHRDQDWHWLKKMQAVADLNGELPDGVEKVLQSFRLSDLA
ncbi:hypothetical protein GJ699_12775 [Duganella sp. FT80W]|uniref:Uncharacterized protein n=1 Tax=Duganella guangzhouensis TaxID=2666084 RepID=A0A6I2L2R0_9BURK|nr:hypothetical protein [Duganella guangzhouensis]MRW90866.1 hypothetical protein [Duganella guangzhouensis]